MVYSSRTGDEKHHSRAGVVDSAAGVVDSAAVCEVAGSLG